jgi:Holliday junction resolvase RusA-like endonuclease
MKIVLPGIPIAKERHRCGCANGRPYAYDPQAGREMNGVRREILKQWNKAFDSPKTQIAMEAISVTKAESLIVTLVFTFPSNDRSMAPHQNAKLWGCVAHIHKPDLDNLEKFYLDCGTGILWKDDCQITQLSSKKLYGIEPKTEITIMKDEDIESLTKDIITLFSPIGLMQFMDDIFNFFTYPSSNIREALQEENPLKFPLFIRMAQDLSEFAIKYSDLMKKIVKINKDYEQKN